MIIQDVTFKSPAENILYDDVLLNLAERSGGGEVLRFWESPTYFIVLGRTSILTDDINIKEVYLENVPVLRRSSGGGTVLQGPGCLNFSLVLSKGRDPKIKDIKQSYQYILEKIIAAMKMIGHELVFKPTSDLATAGTHYKVSGNAQKRGRGYILHHGTVLYNFDISLVEKYLKFPKEAPEYRQGREHMLFVQNLPVKKNDVIQSFKKCFAISDQDDRLSEEQLLCTKKFLEEKTVVEDLKPHLMKH